MLSDYVAPQLLRQNVARWGVQGGEAPPRSRVNEIVVEAVDPVEPGPAYEVVVGSVGGQRCC